MYEKRPSEIEKTLTQVKNDQVELDIPTFNPPTTLSGNSLGSFTPSANLEKIRRSSLTR